MLDFVESNTIYRTIVGSTCYGLNTPTSDIDMKGICIPPKEYYFGLKKFEQQENGKDDTTYAIKKFVSLARDCNPNIIEMLYVDE
ncbi:MAG: nucleotidyltransferase domain-containing protein, partial [Patescibacteria group bacterium]